LGKTIYSNNIAQLQMHCNLCCKQTSLFSWFRGESCCLTSL